MSKRTVIMVVLFAIGTGMLVWVALQPREPKASVTFLGYTNDATGTRLATLVVSNLNSFVVRRQAAYWMDLATSTGGTNQGGGWFSSRNDLNAGAFEIIAVPVPTNQPSWRVLLSLNPDIGIAAEAVDYVSFMFFGFQTPPFLQRRSYLVGSDWIEDS